MSVRKRLYRLYCRLESWIAPGLDFSQHKYERTLNEYVTDRTRWLDLGCGRRVLPPWRQRQEQQVLSKAATIVGLDLDLDSLGDNKSIRDRVFGSVYRLPFSDHSFDFVTANMVVEHIDDPGTLLREVRRVLSPQGLFMLHTPNAWGYIALMSRLFPHWIKQRVMYVLDGRDEADVFPTKYRLNSRSAIIAHTRAAGLSIVDFRFLETNAAFQMIPPLAVIELLWIRLLRRPSLARWRTNVIVVTRKA